MKGLSAAAISVGLSLLALVQAFEDLGHCALGFFLVVVADEAVEDVVAAHGVVDFFFFVVFVELGEVDDAVAPLARRLPVNLEHDLLRFDGRWHSAELGAYVGDALVYGLDGLKCAFRFAILDGRGCGGLRHAVLGAHAGLEFSQLDVDFAIFALVATMSSR